MTAPTQLSQLPMSMMHVASPMTDARWHDTSKLAVYLGLPRYDWKTIGIACDLEPEPLCVCTCRKPRSSHVPRFAPLAVVSSPLCAVWLSLYRIRKILSYLGSCLPPLPLAPICYQTPNTSPRTSYRPTILVQYVLRAAPSNRWHE